MSAAEPREPEPGEPLVYRGSAGWALGFATAGLAASCFVGWAFPLGIVAILIAILALRQPRESRTLAVWALVLATLSLLYSLGWLLLPLLLA